MQLLHILVAKRKYGQQQGWKIAREETLESTFGSNRGGETTQ